MSLIVLANTVGRDAARMLVTDTSNTDSGSGYYATVTKAKSGPRYWKTALTTGAHRIVYINKTNKLSFDYAVIARAKWHDSYDINILSFTTYPGTADTLSTITMADYVGPYSCDYVYSRGSVLEDREAVGIEYADTGYTKYFSQIFFCQSLTFEHAQPRMDFQLAPYMARPVRAFDNYWYLYATASFTLTNVTTSELDTWWSLPLSYGFFLYDDSGTATVGDFIEHKLWHCILLSEQVIPIHDEFNNLALQVGILRQWTYGC